MEAVGRIDSPVGPRRRLVALLVVLVVAAACSDSGSTAASDPTSSTSAESTSSTVETAEEPYPEHTSTVYDARESWICRPDLETDPCRDLDATVTSDDGSTRVEEHEAATDAPIDCFYVYPTVSTDPGPNADMEVSDDDNEVRTVIAQAAPFARSCRVFAPIYRQFPLAAIGGDLSRDARATAYGDVVDAWKTYMSTWNDGRGVIIIGHSQGAGHLARLLADEIDPDETLRSRLVAAYLFGTSVLADPATGTGGDLSDVGACSSANDTGCLVSFSTYRADSPPAANAIFGDAEGDPGDSSDGSSLRAVCVDPVALLGREHASALLSGTGPDFAPRVDPSIANAETPYVSLPDAFDVECARTDTHDYLAVRPVSTTGPRGPVLSGLTTETLGAEWGLHLVDMTLALEDLVDLAARQGDAFEA